MYLCNTDIADHSIIHFIFKPELHRQNDTLTVVAKNKPADLEMYNFHSGQTAVLECHETAIYEQQLQKVGQRSIFQYHHDEKSVTATASFQLLLIYLGASSVKILSPIWQCSSFFT